MTYCQQLENDWHRNLCDYHSVLWKRKIGELKSIMVDKVETIELPLAHIIPEVIGNLLLSLAILFV